MRQDTTPLFIVGCGRSGTQALERLFGHCPDVEMHHEYMVHHTQPLGVKYYHNLISRDQLMSDLSDLYVGAVHYADAKIWGDSSNKLSWMISEMAEIFPAAKFIHVVRDGRKVVSSLFHKLGNECLDDVSVGIMKDYLFDQSINTVYPPHEKKYWWPVAHQNEPDFEEYWHLDQFGRMAFHWAQINNRIEEQFDELPDDRFLQVRLEDITTKPERLAEMMRFAGINSEDGHFEMMRRPHNVIRPENNLLTEMQGEVFWKLCGSQMQRYGYAGTDEYVLNYHPAEHAKRSGV